MFTWTGYDAEPEAMVVPEAQCIVCRRPASADPAAFTRGVLGMVVMAYWCLDADGAVIDLGRAYHSDPYNEVWTPPLIVHKGDCGCRWETVLRTTHGHDLWEDLADWLLYLTNNTKLPTGAPSSRHGILRRHERNIDLRRTADLLDLLPGAEDS